MPVLDLSIDSLLTTTRSVRRRLDLSRPVEQEVIRECLELAIQAPTGSNAQGWHFVVVTDPRRRQDLATLYGKGGAQYKALMAPELQKLKAVNEQEARTLARVLDSAQYLIDHMHEVPVHVIPCIQGRTNNLPIIAQSGFWGSIVPATWSFMLAARSRGLGTSLTSFHLLFEREAAEVLDIPYAEVMQTALIPVAYTLGTDFKPAPRKSLESVLHWDRW
jgi:nitroreductase